MREIDVHEFHRRVIADAEPRFHPLRAAATVVTAGKSRVRFSDWGSWQKLSGDTSRVTLGDWSTWTKAVG